MNSNNKITVTSPLLPPLEEFTPYLEDIWKRKWITNNGHYHQELEKALCEYLKVPFLSLFTNGTLPIMVALQALRITGEVITTPYSFVATTHSLWWNDIKPVFVDIDPKTGNMDPDKIEAAITPKTTAIMPVHVYGNPCDTEKIKKIIAIPTIVIGIFFGIKMMIVGMMVNTLIAYYLNSYWSGVKIGYSFKQQVKDVLPSFILALTMGIAVYFLGELLPFSYIVKLIIQILFGAIFVFVFCEITKFKDYIFVKELVLEKIQSKNR